MLHLDTLIATVLLRRPKIPLRDLDERLLDDVGARRNRLPILLFSERIAEINRIRSI